MQDCLSSGVPMQTTTAVSHLRRRTASVGAVYPGHRLHSTRCHIPAPTRPAWTASIPSCSTHVKLRTTAAAPEAWEAHDGSSQQPAVDFLGVVNDMQTARGYIHTATDPSLAYDILTDYDSCPRVFRSVARSQTVFTEEGGKQVLQAGKWQFLFFKGTFDVRLNVVEAPEERTIVFTLAESTFMRNFEGRWQVEPLPDGGSRAEYMLAVQPLLPIPAAVAPYTSGIFKKQVADLLEDVQAALTGPSTEWGRQRSQ